MPADGMIAAAQNRPSARFGWQLPKTVYVDGCRRNVILLNTGNNPKIAHSAVTEYFQGFRICRTIVGSGRLL